MAYFHVAQHQARAAYAAVDLTTHQFRAVNRDINGRLVKAGAGYCDGILENTPVAGRKGNYYEGGTTPAVAGAPFAREAKLTTDANSALVVAAQPNPAATPPTTGASYQYVAEEAADIAGRIVSVRREVGHT